MIRFLLNNWNLLEKFSVKELIINSSIVLFFLFINFFALTNLFYSSRGIIQYNKMDIQLTSNALELENIRGENNILEVKIKNLVEFNDSDLVDQIIREYLGYASEEDLLIIVN